MPTDPEYLAEVEARLRRACLAAALGTLTLIGLLWLGVLLDWIR